jgi:hypothetical protein
MPRDLAGVALGEIQLAKRQRVLGQPQVAGRLRRPTDLRIVPALCGKHRPRLRVTP